MKFKIIAGIVGTIIIVILFVLKNQEAAQTQIVTQPVQTQTVPAAPPQNSQFNFSIPQK